MNAIAITPSQKNATEQYHDCILRANQARENGKLKVQYMSLLEALGVLMTALQTGVFSRRDSNIQTEIQKLALTITELQEQLKYGPSLLN